MCTHTHTEDLNTHSYSCSTGWTCCPTGLTGRRVFLVSRDTSSRAECELTCWQLAGLSPHSRVVISVGGFLSSGIWQPSHGVSLTWCPARSILPMLTVTIQCPKEWVAYFVPRLYSPFRVHVIFFGFLDDYIYLCSYAWWTAILPCSHYVLFFINVICHHFCHEGWWISWKLGCGLFNQWGLQRLQSVADYGTKMSLDLQRKNELISNCFLPCTSNFKNVNPRMCNYNAVPVPSRLIITITNWPCDFPW